MSLPFCSRTTEQIVDFCSFVHNRFLGFYRDCELASKNRRKKEWSTTADSSKVTNKRLEKFFFLIKSFVVSGPSSIDKVKKNSKIDVI
jgi:hypothetical protein